MNVDEVAKLLDAIGKFIGVFIWPAAIFYILFRFRPVITDFISALGEVSIKGAGFEASAKRRQNEAGAALVAAAVSRPEIGAAPISAANAVKEATQAVEGVSPRAIRKIRNSRILWVDDNPSNNVYERLALEAFGIEFSLATSTDVALQTLSIQRFDAIISDMGRPPDPRAGYTLLEKLRSSGDKTPFIIYAGSHSVEHQTEARFRGAIGSTNRAIDLFEMVISVLRS